jgi:hypothetical protein
MDKSGQTQRSSPLLPLYSLSFPTCWPHVAHCTEQGLPCEGKKSYSKMDVEMILKGIPKFGGGRLGGMWPANPKERASPKGWGR